MSAVGNNSEVRHRTTAEGLGLPAGIRACLFDLDVLTQTAQLHAAAWKETFDPFLRARSVQREEPFVPFDAALDYDRYVDGRPAATASASPRRAPHRGGRRDRQHAR